MRSSSYYYTLYGAAGVRALPTTETIYGAILCGTDGEVEFDGVAKPSDAAGFFTIGVKETPMSGRRIASPMCLRLITAEICYNSGLKMCFDRFER